MKKKGSILKGLYVAHKDNPEPQKHNYFHKLRAMLLDGTLVGNKGEMKEVCICHDNWCEIYHGGWCNCDPDIRVM